MTYFAKKEEIPQATPAAGLHDLARGVERRLRHAHEAVEELPLLVEEVPAVPGSAFSRKYLKALQKHFESTLPKLGFDKAENEPCKVCPLSVYRSLRLLLEKRSRD